MQALSSVADPATPSSRLPTRLADSLYELILFVGMLVCCVDIVNVDLGGVKLKLAYLAFLVLPAVFMLEGPSIQRGKVWVWSLVLLLFVPSLLYSYQPFASVAFFAGMIMSMVIMLSMARVVRAIGTQRALVVLVCFYRASIIASCVFFVTGLQERAHFLLYEASYYAIMLIPYFSIVFARLLMGGVRRQGVDLFLIIAAIVTSASVSMVLWVAMSWLVSAIFLRRLKLKVVVALVLAGVMFIAVTINVNTRAGKIAEGITAAVANPEAALPLAVFVVGNRLQRAWVAYNVFLQFPVAGVGMGALKNYAGASLDAGDFSLDGASASDFKIEMNATNVYLEVAAETGLAGLAGYCLLLFAVFRTQGDAIAMAPLKAAFVVTALALLIESSYLRSYVWALYGIILGFAEAPLSTQARALAPTFLGASPKQRAD